MFRELFLDLKNAGHAVASLTGGLVVTGGNASVTIGHDESGFSTYVQTDTAAGPEYSGETGLTKAAVLQVCEKLSPAVAA
jgi:hypothetical protein